MLLSFLTTKEIYKLNHFFSRVKIFKTMKIARILFFALLCIATLFACTQPNPKINQNPYEPTALIQLNKIQDDAKTGLIPEELSFGDYMILEVSVQQFNEKATEIYYVTFPELKLLKNSFENLPEYIQRRLFENNARYVFYNPSNLSGRHAHQKLPLPGSEESTPPVAETKPAP